MSEENSRHHKNEKRIISEILKEEKQKHRKFILRNIEFISDVLTGEQHINPWKKPCGCPSASPEKLARRKSSGNKRKCAYKKIETKENNTSDNCLCKDPLSGSDSPMDSVASVILAPEKTISERYFDHIYRKTVSDLRTNIGSWKEIEKLDKKELKEKINQISDTPIVEKRIENLYNALKEIKDHQKIENISLRNIPSVRYSWIKDQFTDLPGISSSDAWWLILTALDKPVWPRDNKIDLFLYDLGLITKDELETDNERHEWLEEQLTDWKIPYLHRALAGHAVKASPSYCGERCEIRKFTLSYRYKKQKNREKDSPAIIDLFSGSGGLSNGFVEAGYKVELAIDNNRYATDTYRLNHPSVPHKRVICQDIEELKKKRDLLSYLEKNVDVIVGGPPCQSVSNAGYRARLSNDNDYSVLKDPRTNLYKEYVEIVGKVSPNVVLLENVEGIIEEIGESEKRVIDQIKNALNNTGYICRTDVIDCSEHGIPQERDRVILFGIKKKLETDIEDLLDGLFNILNSDKKAEKFNLVQGLSNIPDIGRGEGADVVAARKRGRPGKYVNENNIGEGTSLTFNHKAREHPMEKDRELFDEVMEPGDTGWSVKYEKGRDDLVEYNVGTRENPAFSDKYRMLDWTEPAPSVVAHLAKDANNFIIPDYYKYVQKNREKSKRKYNRGVTPREAARLQSFPDDYIFLGPFVSQFRQIGNAVPPLLAKKLGEKIKQKIITSKSSDKFKKSTSRIALINK